MDFEDSSHYTYHIRTAAYHDLQFLPAIESSAAELFRSDPDLTPLADDETMSVSQHEEYLRGWESTGIDLNGSSGTWVATALTTCESPSEEIVAFIVTQPLRLKKKEEYSDRERLFVHVKELSVHARHQRRGLASALVREAKHFAASHGTDGGIYGLSLTTFRDVPFNGPFYAKLGFLEVPIADIRLLIDDTSVKIWEDEQEHFANVGDGSLKKRRCWMIATL